MSLFPRKREKVQRQRPLRLPGKQPISRVVVKFPAKKDALPEENKLERNRCVARVNNKLTGEIVQEISVTNAILFYTHERK